MTSKECDATLALCEAVQQEARRYGLDISETKILVALPDAIKMLGEAAEIMEQAKRMYVGHIQPCACIYCAARNWLARWDGEPEEVRSEPVKTKEGKS